MTTRIHTRPFGLGEARSHAALTVIPLFPLAEPEAENMGLDEASARGFRVSQVGAEGVVEWLAVAKPTVRLRAPPRRRGAHRGEAEPRRPEPILVGAQSVAAQDSCEVRRARTVGATLAALPACTPSRLSRAERRRRLLDDA